MSSRVGQTETSTAGAVTATDGAGAGAEAGAEFTKLSKRDRVRLFAYTQANRPVLSNALSQAMPYLPAVFGG